MGDRGYNNQGYHGGSGGGGDGGRGHDRNQQKSSHKEYPGASFIQHERGYSDEYYQDQQQYYDPNYYGHYQQHYHEQQYPQYEGQYDGYDDADLSNLDEIDRALASLQTDGPDYGDHEDEPTPSGALPSVNGVLTSHAAQFWFPESRDCTCCQGFKHGCQCCRSGVRVCTVCAPQKPSGESLPPPEKEDSALPPSVPSPAEISTANKSPSVEIPVKETSTANKKLVIEAPSPTTASRGLGMQAEYWFPECRNCSCCQGFKHGCNCCKSGSRVCSCVAHLEASNPPSKKAGECAYFKSGNCKYGDSCRFRHT